LAVFIVFISLQMSDKDLPKAYEHKGTEDEIYKKWEESGCFTPPPQQKNEAEPFTIPIPPPNATAVLHMGSAMMLAIEDLLARHWRLRGRPTLWLPGTDHAAIATQNVVEKKVFKEERKTRHELGREELLRRIDEFVTGTRDNIRQQMRRMGCSLDWSRERFTLDDGLSRAVRMVFRDMYNDGLIYRGNRIVNWCTRCQTTLADDEVEYKEEKVPFYHFKFGPFSIGTVRPETKLGDKYVVVHPDDERYTKFHGTRQSIPWINGEVEMEVLADIAADPEMGSGAMTITPQHSFTDFEIAERHALEVKPNIIGLDGKLTKQAGEFEGLDVRKARERFVEILQTKGLIEKIDEDYVHNVSVCYRCDTPVEPLVSKQWFVNVNKPIKKLGEKSLREKALEVVQNGEIKIIPDRFEKIYYNWMNNLHDWCISRQIWFGHRIPVWYKDEEIFVGIEAPEGEGWVQDEDTLDTWFSSGLWTFSTLLDQNVKVDSFEEWRKQSPDLKRFHPTSVLETGYDIIFFWVARMILMTNYAMEEIPFRTVYLHGLVTDQEGKKMSKSLGNGIDPIEVTNKYGADPVRLSLLIGTTPGNNVRMYDEKIAGYRNFVNKLWNISRYILMTTTETDKKVEPTTLADRWILAEFENLKRSVTDKIENFNFSPAGEELYEFTWSKLADWYVEIAKIEGNKDAIIRHILCELLILWHPYTPYVTEHIWSQFNDNMLITQKWPEIKSEYLDVKDFDFVKNTITASRDIKQELGTLGKIDIVIYSPDYAKLLEEQKNIIEGLAKVNVFFGEAPSEQATKRVLAGITVYTNTEASPEIKARQAKEKTELEKYIKGLRNKLNNKEFRANAPKNIVEAEEKKLKEAEEKLAQLT
jgi:valyl-tRNA synthetase